MIIKGRIKRGEYFDSVTLMLAARRLGELPGVRDSAIVMGTRENQAILAASGLLLDEFRDSLETDLLIALSAADEAQAVHALAEVNSILKSMRVQDESASAVLPRTMDAAVQLLPSANLALISVAGRYAGNVAMQALERGLHVMLFSDNVPLEQELALKQYAVGHNLLVMGPDCGTAIINGVPLGFANAVRRGRIGIVAAAGTGLQEVSCLISNAGAGISQAIGTGGRDVRREIGGLMFVEGFRRLMADPATAVIVLVSKPPHPDVLETIGKTATGTGKPVVAAFLGTEPGHVRQYGMHPATTLAEAARCAVALARGEAPDSASAPRFESTVTIPLLPGQKYVRGLFSGGTFCYEAQLLLQDVLPEISSNAPTGRSRKLGNALHSEGHTLVDLGEDEFTVGRPHPMIDYSLRNKRMLEEAADPATAVILLDVVLGYGSHPDPLADLLPAISTAHDIASRHQRSLPIVCSVTGTDGDPQNRARVAAGLSASGVVVLPSNAAACVCAGRIVTARAGGAA